MRGNKSIQNERPHLPPLQGGNFNTADVGILLPLVEEFSELHKQLEGNYQTHRREGGIYHYSFQWPSNAPQHPYRCVACFAEIGETSAAMTTRTLLETWNPATFVLVGIAAGLHKDVCLGDVVLASVVDQYMERAAAVSRKSHRGFALSLSGEPYRPTTELLNDISNLRFAHPEVYDSWSQSCGKRLIEIVPERARGKLETDELVRQNPILVKGHIASGPIVSKARVYGEWLKTSRDRNYLALEMEAGGAMAALEYLTSSATYRSLVLRGISDFGDERKNAVDALSRGIFRRVAVRNALDLLRLLMVAGLLPRSYGGSPNVSELSLKDLKQDVGNQLGKIWQVSGTVSPGAGVGGGVRSQSARLAEDALSIFRMGSYVLTKPLEEIDGGHEFLVIRQVTGPQAPLPVCILVQCYLKVPDEAQLKNLASRSKQYQADYAWIISGDAAAPGYLRQQGLPPSVEIHTIDRILREVIDLRPYFATLERLVQEEKILNYFVVPGCKSPAFDERGFPVFTIDDRPEPARSYASLETYVRSWLTEPGRNYLALLGDFGTGKTWFCKHLAYNKYIEYLRDPWRHRIPILVPLKGLASTDDVWQLVTQILCTRYGVSEGSVRIADLLRELNLRGQLLLIFDGFDEIDLRVEDTSAAERHLDAFADVACPSSKLIVTSRTSYFRSLVEEMELLSPRVLSTISTKARPSFEVVHISEFSDTQVRAALRKRLPREWRQAHDMIKRKYDLVNLAPRAVMLDMIVGTLRKLADLRSVTHAKLYEIYTEEWIEKDITDERTLVDAPSKMDCLQAVAWEMYRSGKLAITAHRIRELLAERYTSRARVRKGNRIDLPIETLKPEFLEHDLRLSSFVRPRDLGGRLEFTHRSFMEYFIARKLADAVKSGDPGPFEQQQFYYEIIRFLNQLLSETEDNKALYTFIRWMEDSKSAESLRTNYIRILGTWVREDVLEKLVTMAGRTDEPSGIRRDAVRSILRLAYGEEVDLPEEAIKETLWVYAIRTSRATLQVGCLPIQLKVRRQRFVGTSEARKRIQKNYHNVIGKLCLGIVSRQDPDEVRINASMVLVHSGNSRMIEQLIQQAIKDQEAHVSFNCAASVLLRDPARGKALVKNLMRQWADTEMVEYARQNLRQYRHSVR